MREFNSNEQKLVEDAGKTAVRPLSLRERVAHCPRWRRWVAYLFDGLLEPPPKAN